MQDATGWKRLGDIHVCWELAERLVEVVHLCENAHARDDHENVGRGMGELVVAGESQLQGDAEGLDGHDRHGSHEGADAEVDERVLLSVDGRDFVDHEDGEGSDRNGVNQETCPDS